MFKKQPIYKNYVSEIDKALAQFDATHSLSSAQQDEVNKYKRIYQLRDNATTLIKIKDIWEFE
jgi:hypothetical protein